MVAGSRAHPNPLPAAQTPREAEAAVRNLASAAAVVAVTLPEFSGRHGRKETRVHRHPDSSLANKDVDGKLRSRFDRPHKNKNDWLDFGALLFWCGTVLRWRPRDGHPEAERAQIKRYPWDGED